MSRVEKVIFYTTEAKGFSKILSVDAIFSWDRNIDVVVESPV